MPAFFGILVTEFNAMKNTAVLLINCPDRKGIVATVSGFLYKHNANILHADQHQDSELNLFFQRIEWDLNGFDLSNEEFKEKFRVIAKEFKMTWRLGFSNYLPKVAIFVSKEDHCLADLLYRYKSQELLCQITMVISNHADVKDTVEFYDIPFREIEVEKDNKSAAEQKALKILKEEKIDLVVLARYMQILSADFIRNLEMPIINIHHSFLPAFIGAKPYHQAYNRGVKIIGATSHYVSPDLDSGPIIEQDTVRISHSDSIADLIRKGKDIEKVVLSRAVRWHLENRILVYGNKTVVFD